MKKWLKKYKLIILSLIVLIMLVYILSHSLINIIVVLGVAGFYYLLSCFLFVYLVRYKGGIKAKLSRHKDLLMAIGGIGIAIGAISAFFYILSIVANDELLLQLNIIQGNYIAQPHTYGSLWGFGVIFAMVAICFGIMYLLLHYGPAPKGKLRIE